MQVREILVRIHLAAAALMLVAAVQPGARAEEPAPSDRGAAVQANGELDEATRSALGIGADPAADHLQPRLPVPVTNSGPAPWTHGPLRYDGSGNIATIGTQSFLYDTTGRLKQATLNRPDQSGSQVQSYAYDDQGNLIQRTTNGTVQTISTSTATNHLTLPFAEYDVAGNLVRWQSQGQAQPAVFKASFDALGMMQELTVENNAAAAHPIHIYTPGDERIWTWDMTANVLRWTLRDLDGKVLREYVDVNSGTWSVNRDYIYRDGALLAAVTPSGTEHFSLDHLGTPRVITGNDKVRMGFHHYLPFGEEWLDNNGAQEGEPMKFTGHERDKDAAGGTAGLDYMRARYYGANLGRFLSLDPVLNLKRALREPQNWNRYAYVMNNPLKYTDPTGKDVSIRLSFQGDGWTEEDKKKIIAQVTSWYQNQKVGKVFVFDGAKANHGGNFLTRMFSGGYTSMNVSSGTGSKHTPSTVFAGNYSGLSAGQRINAISNSIIHETVAHRFGATDGNNADQMFFARDSGYGYWGSVRQRYGTVADSYSYADPNTRGNVINGPIPIHPDDQRKLQSILRDEHVEPPDYDN